MFTCHLQQMNQHYGQTKGIGMPLFGGDNMQGTNRGELSIVWK
jgi:hypothetical protein